MSGVSDAGFTVTKEGDFRDLCTAGWNAASVANIVSQGKLKDAGCTILYDDEHDEFHVASFVRMGAPNLHTTPVT